MSNITIVTDSTAYIPSSYLENEKIHRVPLYINFEGETNPEGLPGEFDDFYNRLENSKSFPSTSQPSTGDFIKIFEKIFEKNPEREIIVLTLSSKLSGTYNSACSAAEMVAPGKISVVDSLSAVANLHHLVKITKQLIEEEHTREDIVKTIEAQKKRAKVYVTVGSLSFLKKGGRLSGSQAALGSVLNIKPIITLENGILYSIDKVRGKKKALNKMVSMIIEQPTHLSICHINAEDEAEGLRQKLQEKHPELTVGIEIIGPVIGAHLGPKAIGFCYLY
ncbi:DegV family protein [Isachenkonia alkalipeptolytica]|uniref:DegV family protein n=1 Tax=Isachenkonia alkalipeptolytica TaxID=2565777 RepID=A0AA43XJE8_9CLOT|nr:DegV family protein [Isachenkonia alkalipeptolytica]NBG87411.1 DegV family protein [Isachenkonia alkalipeptolytica]